MLQIIGWLMCFCLVIKGLEISASNNFRDQDGRSKEFAPLIAALAFLGAIGFGLWLHAQGASFPPSPNLGAAMTETCEETRSC